MKSKQRTLSLSITRGTVFKAVCVYILGVLAEYIVQESFYTEFVALKPLLLMGFEVSRPAILALVVFALSVVLSYLIKGVVRKKLLDEPSNSRLGFSSVFLIICISMFVALSGLLNGFMVLERLEASGINLDGWVEVSLLVLMLLSSWLALIVSAIAGAILMTVQPILKLARRRKRVQSQLLKSRRHLKRFKSKLVESEKLFIEIEASIWECVKLGTLDLSKINLNEFLDHLNDKKDV